MAKILENKVVLESKKGFSPSILIELNSHWQLEWCPPTACYQYFAHVWFGEYALGTLQPIRLMKAEIHTINQ